MRDRKRKKIMAGLIVAEILSQSIPCISMAAEHLPSAGAGLLKEQYYEKELKKQRKLPYRLLKLQQIVSTCGKVRGQTHRLSDSWNKVPKRK